MKVGTTKVMAKALKDLEGHDIIDEVRYVEMDDRNYRWYVNYTGGLYQTDYNEKTDMYKTIKIIYHPCCYAMPRYLTTDDLTRCFRNSDKTWDDFINEVWKEVEI